MKKFLLVLSCFLATWCSVQAGPKSSPEISLMQASAPAAAPVTIYPAVITSASHNPNTQEISVSYYVNTPGVVAFDLETADGRKSNLNGEYRSVGSYTTKIKLRPEWKFGEYASVMISVGGNICGGTGVRIMHATPSVKISMISYSVRNKTVKVEYSIENPKSETCRVKVFKNGSTGSTIINQIISSSSNVYEIPSSKFIKGVGYYVEVSCGSEKAGQNYEFDDQRAGHMGEVSCAYSHVQFKYNLKNAVDPYICIKRGSKNGSIVAKIKIENTNGVYKDAYLCNFRSVLEENTWYVADLYDGSEDLRIFSEEFMIPNEIKEDTPLTFDWTHNPNTNQVEVWCTSSPSPKVKIELYRNQSGSLTLQDHRTEVPRNQVVRMGTPYRNSYYTIVVTSGDKRVSKTVMIR